MFLKKSRQRNGRVHLSIVRAYREGGKHKTRTVKTLGYLDDLEKEHEDPIAHFTAEAKRMTEEERAEHAPVSLAIHPDQKIDKKACGARNIGCAVPLSLYNGLGVEKAIRSATRGMSIRFDANAVARLLVCERLFHPGSKLSAWQNRQGYFFRSEFSEDDVYRALDVFADNKMRIVGAMNRALDRMGYRSHYKLAGRKNPAHNTYYDVTNYYFEVSEPDGFRAKGVSKEHRPDPIVQMGLLQDENALPIAYRLFPGNTNDCTTMMPLLDELKGQYDLGRVVVVADKGLNTSANIAVNVASGNGFVFSQSIRGTKSKRELREWVLSDEGYRERDSGAFKVKSRQCAKCVHLKAEDTASGKAKDVEVEVKVVAFWSKKYAERARHERQETIRRARELVSNPGAYSAHTHYGAAKYVRGLEVDPETGEVLEGDRVLSFDEGRLREDEACDGFYCIVTSETGMSDEEVIDAYRGLWRIEESFKLTKSCLKARPVYVRTREHIEAHFLICYIALTLLRLMQLKTEGKHSAETMLEELRKLEGHPAEGNWWLFDHRSEVTDALFASVGIEHPRKWMTTASVKALLGKNKAPAGR